MYISRDIDKELLGWKTDVYRKPLLLRGARQVGKTNSVRELSKHFKYFLEINFEENKEISKLFEANLSPIEICENLSLFYNIPIIEGETLLFFDEIQQCIPAIRSLRFFYEKMPGLHVIAAGSLLEFAIEDITSFGVGRIRSVFMYPLSFNEFLVGCGEEALLTKKNESSPEQPINEILHEKLVQFLKKFLILGGMPEVISTYIQTKDFNRCQKVLDDLVYSFQDDFAKYKKNVPTSRLREVFDSVILQSGSKFVFSKATIQSNHKQVKEALNLLIMAGLVFPVKHTSANGLPLGAEVNPKKQKMLLFDTGIFQRILQFKITDTIFSDNIEAVNKGKIAEIFTGLEMLKYQTCYQRNELYYWHREAHNSNAEVDYLFIKENKIFPVEIKAGTKGAMQSMFLFLTEKKKDKGIRVSLENFSKYNVIDVYPLYAISNLIN
ncbi:MAG: AAA family ATPase [Bacteroidales bacterium]|nr:AAA family ATPase [Bacteroidales bacterium]